MKVRGALERRAGKPYGITRLRCANRDQRAAQAGRGQDSHNHDNETHRSGYFYTHHAKQVPR
jgi:hypothetical protein